jgi:hypothetical protein
VLFQDDFSKTSSGWDRVRDPSNGITDYENNAYRITVLTQSLNAWATPNLSFKDVRIDADTSKAAGPDDNRFGIICRYQDPNNLYFFAISSDGYYGIFKVKNGQEILLGKNQMQPSDVIQKGGVINHLRAECVGSRLTLFVNDRQLDTQQDTDFSSGDVGLMAGSALNQAGTDIYFDNFSVTQP